MNLCGGDCCLVVPLIFKTSKSCISELKTRGLAYHLAKRTGRIMEKGLKVIRESGLKKSKSPKDGRSLLRIDFEIPNAAVLEPQGTSGP